ncbi:MAG: glycosyl hydrolase family 65 protein [Verrucomicrobiota bacterium]
MNNKVTNEPWYSAGDPWVLTQSEWSPEKNIYFETIFTQSNGYMGVRGYTEETNTGLDAVREGYLAGVFATIDGEAVKQIRVNYDWRMLAMITLPELFACKIELNGESFHLSEGTLSFYSRSLNMRNGVLSRHVIWTSPKGLRTRLLFERFLSAAVPHLGVQQITVTPENWNGTAVLDFELDGKYPTYFRCGDRSYSHPVQDLIENPRIDVRGEGSASLDFKTRGTGHLVSIASEVSGAGCVSLINSAVLNQKATLTLLEGKSEAVLHTVAVVSSRDETKPEKVPDLAATIARDAINAGYETTLSESEEVWDYRWSLSDVMIDGPARDQAYIRFSSFSMLQMAPFHTDNMSIPARAYAYNRYHGLYYWDSETFLMPHYLHTHPEVAENLLKFRYRTLDGARRTARQLKAPGACFPWMTDSDDGTEQGPWGIGDYLWHQNADIAYAIDQYVEATGNTDFMADQGLEMMMESARFWMSRVEEDETGVVHLHDTVGPDELDKHGKDNGYTSLMARRHFRLAAKWAERLKVTHPQKVKALFEKLEIRSQEIAEWSHAADRMAAPMVPGENFPLQDEFLVAKKPLNFEGMTADEAFAMRHTHRVVKQSDIVLVMYLLQDEFTVEQMRAAYEFYEPMTLHFSSLSYNTHSILATKIGRDDVAYDYFMKAAGLDLDNLRDATNDGLHAAALGGTWQTLVYGFLGMRLVEGGIAFEPRLPEAWKSVSLGIVYRGYRLRLSFSHDVQRIEVEGSEGAGEAQLILNGEAHSLKDGLSITSSVTALKN